MIVRVAIAGPEVAKWLSGLAQAKYRAPGTAVADGIWVAHSSLPVYRDFDDELGLPTLGDAEVEFQVMASALPADVNDPAGLAQAALAAVNEASGGLLARVEKLRVEVEAHG